MSVQSVSPLPLNHYFHEIPAASASAFRCKALTLSVLEKISWIAFLAIMAIIFTVSYAGISPAGHLPMVLVSMALIAPLIGLGASQLNIKSLQYNNLAKIEEGVAAELRKIAHWGISEIETFLTEQNLNLTPSSRDALRQKNPETPLRALLPLIARFKFLYQHETNTVDASRRELTRPINDRFLRLTNRQIAYAKYEGEALPAGLDAAVLLQIIQHPTLELSLKEICTLVTKTYEERNFDRMYGPDDSNAYCVFNASTHLPLSLDDLEHNLSPRELRRLLFP